MEWVEPPKAPEAMPSRRTFFLAALALAATLIPHPLLAQAKTLRAGHFPNLTHAQALVARAMTRQGKPFIEPRLGPGWKIEWYTYNAGPSAMEAILARSLDLTYVGPNPALNLYFRSAGDEPRVLAGACLGGAALVVPKDSKAAQPNDFRGKRIATPQLGNTQDIACRAWLLAGGLKIGPTGAGDAFVVPTANPDQLALFQQGKLDGVWTVEPWVSRLEREASGRVIVEQKDDVTTILVARRKFLEEQADVAKKFAAAHEELTKWIIDHPDEAREMIRAELKEITRSDVNPELIAAAIKRLTFSAKVPKEGIAKQVDEARKTGLLRGETALDKLFPNL